MAPHQHRAGALRQSNKKHKAGKHATKTLLAKRSGGKVERRASTRSASSASANAALAHQKQARVLRQKQLREHKRDELMLQRRFGLGSALGPPKMVALVALSAVADLAETKRFLLDGAATIEQPRQHALRNCTVGVFAQHKQKVGVIDCGNDLLVAMDAAKVADVLVLVLPLQQGSEASVNVAGAKILSAIRAQGVPSTVGVLQGLEAHPPKLQSDLRKFGASFFQSEFGEGVKVTQANVNAQLSRAVLSLSPKVLHWREARSYLHATAATIVPHANGDGKGELRVSGYIRGKPLSVNQLIHITDVGTFQMSHITRAEVQQVDAAKEGVADEQVVTGEDEGMVLATADPALQEDLRFEAEYDPFAAEQTWPTTEELEEAEKSAKGQPQDAGKGMSSYQAAWIGDDDEAEEGGDDEMRDEEEDEEDHAAGDDVDQAFCQTAKSEEEDDEGDDDDMSMDDESDAARAQHWEEMQAKRKQEAENMTFPDEVDVPTDSSARVRFARYRGLKSLRTSSWDPKESLPQDYARLFQFEDFPMVQRLALQRGKEAERAMKAELRRKSQAARSRASSMASAMDVEDGSSASGVAIPVEFGTVGYVPSGVYVTLHIKDVPLQAFQARLQAGPLIMGALLKHENRLSVLNFSIQRSGMFADPIKSKEEVVFHCGFRRYAAKPVYSDQSLKSDQHLFQRFLPQSGWSVATVYAPVTFQPASVLLFRGQGHGNLVSDELVASGTLMNVNPDRVVLKRIILTGTPVKVKKRKAVVRYMFHSPEDIRWFKPVELTTKHGLTGHIKESLGTHGDLKAVFNKPIKQHDTVCLHLYKRVYPKFAD